MQVAVYGATGYQGKLIVAELIRRGVRAVLVGRDEGRLAQAASLTGVPDLERRVAALDDRDALVAAFADCAAVINSAGPFTHTGAAVVDAAVAARTPYVDTAGEQAYLKSLFDEFDTAARSAGVPVVPGVNDGCLPGDLVAHLVADEIDEIDTITISHEIAGDAPMSRGSVRSAIATADAFRTGGLVYLEGRWRAGVPLTRRTVTIPDRSKPVALAPAPLAEVVTIPRHVRARRVEGAIKAGLAATVAEPIPENVVESLPVGPTAEERRRQRFTYVLEAAGPSGTARGTIQGTDTYGTTATIAALAAIRLAGRAGPSGALAAAHAFDARSFLDELGAAGLAWHLTPRSTLGN